MDNKGACAAPLFLSDSLNLAPSFNVAFTPALTNAKRFQKPEVHVVPAIAFGSWILATDGYRYRESDDTGHPKDDCSALLIGSGLEAEPAAAHNNLFVRTSPP